MNRCDPTVELTRRRESRHPTPHQASCETRCRRSRPTTDCVKTLTLKVRIIINVRECDQKGAALMDYIRGVSREQVMLFPESVEDYITEDDAVRFINAFVSGLDLAGLGFRRARPAETGRPAYNPGDLLRRYFNAARLTKAIKAIEEKIDGYLDELDEADAADSDVDEPRPSAVELHANIKTLQQRKTKYQALHEGLQASGAKQVSLTDADARSMAMHHGSPEVGYNVQTVVDEKHQLIVEHEVTNDPTDHAHLAEMALRAKEILQVEQLEVVADMGYYDGAEVKQCAQAGITTYIPKPITSVNRKRGLFTKQDFVYDEA